MVKSTISLLAEYPPFFLPERCPFAVLLDEDYFLPFKKTLQARTDITHVFLVTNSNDGFKDMKGELGSCWQVKQLYNEDYLEKFKKTGQQEQA